MINVIKKDWDELKEEYVLTLADGDKVHIPESKYDLIQVHTSEKGKKLNAIVNEHDDDSEPIEYLGFKLI